MRFRALDIETVPDESFWTPGEPRWKLVPCQHHSRHRGVCGEPVLVGDESFPPPQAHRVVALATADVVLDVEGSPRYRFDRCWTSCQWSVLGDSEVARAVEHRLLEDFGTLMGGEPADLVTWNGRGFDLPVISMRSLLHGISCPWYYGSRDVRYRYSTEGHLDLMDFLSDYGAARCMKLGDVARLVGLPGKTGEVTGASVRSTYEETLARSSDVDFCRNMMDAVGRYCLRDALQTALVFLRTRYHVGKIDQEEHDRCLATFRESPDVRAAIDVDWGRVSLCPTPAPGQSGGVGGR